MAPNSPLRYAVTALAQDAAVPPTQPEAVRAEPASAGVGVGVGVGVGTLSSLKKIVSSAL